LPLLEALVLQLLAQQAIRLALAGGNPNQLEPRMEFPSHALLQQLGFLMLPRPEAPILLLYRRLPAEPLGLRKNLPEQNLVEPEYEQLPVLL